MPTPRCGESSSIGSSRQPGKSRPSAPGIWEAVVHRLDDRLPLIGSVEAEPYLRALKMDDCLGSSMDSFKFSVYKLPSGRQMTASYGHVPTEARWEIGTWQLPETVLQTVRVVRFAATSCIRG